MERPNTFAPLLVDSPQQAGHFLRMSTLAEIEEAIETLPVSQVDKLAEWLNRRRAVSREPLKADKREAVAAFLRRWTGAGIASTTDDEMRAQRTARLIGKHVK